ncbi:MAG: tetratricopeptide repeat protein [Alphaproteobacteria bacterium]|nr:tetratricopeptide repeat protein [Alphaproteobacteria bacterium]
MHIWSASDPKNLRQILMPKFQPISKKMNNLSPFHIIRQSRLALAVIILLAIAHPSLSAEEPNKPPEPPNKPEQIFVRIQGEPYQLQDGIDAYNKRDFAQSFKIFNKLVTQSLAKEDRAAALTKLALLYLQGQGTPRNYAKAAALFHSAAVAGNAEAANNLGVLYAQGLGLPKDYNQAIRWYIKAANLNNAQAMSNLGVVYAKGQGVNKDWLIAVDFFRKAAETGNNIGKYNYALAYESGRGIGADAIKAAMWLTLSLDNLPQLARSQANKHYDKITRDFSSEQKGQLKSAIDKCRQQNFLNCDT